MQRAATLGRGPFTWVESRCWELNPEPRLYESRALPLSYIGSRSLWSAIVSSLRGTATGIKWGSGVDARRTDERIPAALRKMPPVG